MKMKRFKNSNYYVNEKGQVFSQRKNGLKELKAQKIGKYLGVNIRIEKNTKPKIYYIHRMIAECFLETWNEKLEVNHLNMDKHDNRIENLEMVTRQENSKHYFSNQTTHIKMKDPNYRHNLYEKNKDRYKDSIQKWRDEHPERVKNYNKKYYKKIKSDPEKLKEMREYQKQYQEARKEKSKILQKKYYLKRKVKKSLES